MTQRWRRRTRCSDAEGAVTSCHGQPSVLITLRPQLQRSRQIDPCNLGSSGWSVRPEMMRVYRRSPAEDLVVKRAINLPVGLLTITPAWLLFAMQNISAVWPVHRWVTKANARELEMTGNGCFHFHFVLHSREINSHVPIQFLTLHIGLTH